MIRGVLTSFVALVIIGAGIGLGGPSHPSTATGVQHMWSDRSPIRPCSRVAD